MDQGTEVKMDPRRALPAVDRLVAAAREYASPEVPAWAVKAAARGVVAEARDRLSEGGEPPELAALVRETCTRAEGLARPRPGRVVNATGVILHTNLGRAPLAEAAAGAVARIASCYCDLELDLGEGRRGERLAAIRELLVLLSGAEAALAVNNNAAAVFLIANTFGRDREVVVSRGELVEIGGSFRVPEILERAGARLVEVGTTNRTHVDDYRRAIGERTGLLLKVHRSNFEQRGFVAEVALEELVRLGREAEVPVAEDLGSGTLVDLRDRGLPAESYAPARLALGADLVCFSGDKLLGGPQAGVVLGRRGAVGALARNPLVRALRLDKLDVAALDWTLRTLLEGRGETEIPVLRQLLEPPERVAERAGLIAERLRRRCGDRIEVSVQATRAPVGGGSVPGFALASAAVVLRAARSAEALAAALRECPVPILTRVQDDAVLLDVRTLLAGDEDWIEQALLSVSR